MSRFAVSRKLIFVGLLFPALALGSPKPCVDLLSSQQQVQTIKSTARDEIYTIAQEVKAFRPQEGAPASPSWKKHAVLRSEAAFKTLKKMETYLVEGIQSSQPEWKASYIQSASFLLNTIQEMISNFSTRGIEYHYFLKLSAFFAIHMDHFASTGDYAKSRSLNAAMSSPLVPSGGVQEGFGTFFKSQADLARALESDETLAFRRAAAMELYVFAPARVYHDEEPLVFVPTFANLGFESLLWLQSRGVAALGLSKVGLHVDRVLMLPFKFFAHDYEHAIFSRHHVSNGAPMRTYEGVERASEFYDTFEREITKSSKTKRERLIKMAIVFTIFHEDIYSDFSPECDGGQIRELVENGGVSSFFSSFNRNRERLRDSSSDLGIAFGKELPTHEEMNDAVLSLRKIFWKACVKKKRPHYSRF